MSKNLIPKPDGYDTVLNGITVMLEAARRASARAVNSVMTTTYWEVGRRIVEFEQGGEDRAEYGENLVRNLAKDLTSRFGRGFGRANLYQMRAFYRTWTLGTLNDGETRKVQTASGLSGLEGKFPLPWSHYVTLLGVKHDGARAFYERETLAGGWTIRQLKTPNREPVLRACRFVQRQNKHT